MPDGPQTRLPGGLLMTMNCPRCHESLTDTEAERARFCSRNRHTLAHASDGVPIGEMCNRCAEREGVME